MKNYQKVNVPAGEARVELHDSLNLTGAEVSISNLPAGAGVPFVHSHKQNEEIYAVLSGRGTMVVDGDIYYFCAQNKNKMKTRFLLYLSFSNLSET